MPYELECAPGVDPDIARQLAEAEVSRLAGQKVLKKIEKIEITRRGDEYVLTVHTCVPLHWVDGKRRCRKR